jgi:ATP-dependent Clp protease ATP-binding subunit ClpA
LSTVSTTQGEQGSVTLTIPAEKFTEKTRLVLDLAQEEARELHHNYVGTEHLLLGLLHEGESIAYNVLHSLGIEIEAAVDALIEAGIRSTRSDAAAWLIHAGIEANRPLFEKVYGTVVEIRRLRGVAQSLAQEVAESGEVSAESTEEQSQ